MKTLKTISLGLLLGLPSGVAAGQQVPLKAVYNQAATNWEEQALPIGNGYMGAMVFGGVISDKIQTNEKTLWSGGPAEDKDYNGGLLHSQASAHKALQDFRRKLQANMSQFSSEMIVPGSKNYPGNGNYYLEADGFSDYDGSKSLLNGMLGTKDHFGSFQTLSEIMIDDIGFPTLDAGSIYTNFDNKPGSNQRIGSLFDGNKNSKWFAELHDGKTFPVVVSWNYTKPAQVSGYTLVSGNDMAVRDPKHWKLYGSADGKDYILIDERDGIFWGSDNKAHRNEAVRFELAQPVSGYKYFRLEILALQGTNQKPQLSELEMEIGGMEYSDYNRVLDLDEGMQYVTYKLGQADYRREYFMSYPDNVMVVRIASADGTTPVSRKFSLSCSHSEHEIIINEDGQIVLEGYPTPVSAVKTRNNPDYKNGEYLKFAQVLNVNAINGTVSVDNANKTVTVDNADEIILLMSAATNYDTDNYHTAMYADTYNFVNKSIDPLVKAKGFVDAAKTKDYEQLLSTHQADYKRLFDANKVNLGGISSTPAKTTDALLEGMKNSSNTLEENNYLETLYYQFGRYLLISSSRPGSLPANLQGVWGKDLANAWNSDYHTNINVQMNYWPAEQTNLSECHLPMTDFVRSLAPKGKLTARHYHVRPDGRPVRGWTTYHEVNAWGNTNPAAKGTHSYFPEGALWICQDIWEHYQFTQNKKFLEDNYDTLLGACLFWVDNLWTDERDGSLVANPSLSPEHGDFSLGCTATQGIIYEMFSATVEASIILGKNESKEVKEIKDALGKLSMPKIGIGGQFMEWKDEVARDLTGDGRWDEAEQRYTGTHRHTNHLFWLHPGSSVIPGRSEAEDDFAKAMKVTLNTRGDEGTGWSRAWKLNFWARLRSGNRAHSLLKGCMNLTSNYSGAPGGVYANLFDAHPPFQIDGNFGVTSGIAEMLLQSQGGDIELLPAVPDAWAKGSFNGMKARGGYEVDASWDQKSVRTATIKNVANETGFVTVKFKGAHTAAVAGATDVDNSVEHCLTFHLSVGSEATLNSSFVADDDDDDDESPNHEIALNLQVPGTIIAGMFDSAEGTYYHKGRAEGGNYANDFPLNRTAKARITGDGVICNTAEGDYYQYSFNCKKRGKYVITGTFQGVGTGRKVNVDIDGSHAGVFRFDGEGWPSGDDNKFVTASLHGVELSEERHVMKVTQVTGGLNLVSFKFETDENTSVNIVTDNPTDSNMPVDVYTIDGIKVKSRVPSAHATYGLAPGIYIVGNKKVVVYP